MAPDIEKEFKLAAEFRLADEYDTLRLEHSAAFVEFESNIQSVSNFRLCFALNKDLEPIVSLERKQEYVSWSNWSRVRTRPLNFRKTIEFLIKEDDRNVIKVTLDETKDGLYIVYKKDRKGVHSDTTYMNQGYVLNDLEWSLVKRNIDKIRRRLVDGFTSS